MKTRGKIITILTVLIVVAIYFIDFIYAKNYETADKAFLVYLNGKEIGMIKSDVDLYNLINDEQKEIKNKYSVDSVYPPDDFDLVEVNTYAKNYMTVSDVYNKIAELDNFTIKGYIVTVKFPEEEKKEITINVLDKNIFEEAIRNFICAFISEEELDSYIAGEKKTLTDIGSIINTMFFNETITIKEGYISVNDKIYTDVDELSQYLLFGPNAKMSNYVVKLGDDIESISDEHKLNPQEFIIANPQYRDENTLLAVGSKVNVTLLNPILTFIYEVYRIEESIVPFSKTQVVDNTKDYGYSEITQSGVTGITLNHENYQVKNGEQSSEIKIVYSEVKREKVDQITTVGKKSYVSGSYVDLGGDWGWPTNQPSVITSKYGMRWGKLHEGLDISGTGYGSPIYSVGDGVVVQAVPACKSCLRWSNGNYVVVKHEGNIYSGYLHMAAIKVKVDDVVKKGQQVGTMGESGFATGVHLHFGLYEGEPYVGGTYRTLNPMKSIFNQ